MKNTSNIVKIGKINLFSRFLLPYLALLILPLIIGSIMYSHTIKLLSSNLQQANKSTLIQCQVVLDQLSNELDRIYLEKATNTQVNRFLYLNDPYEYPTAYVVNETMKSLNTHHAENSLILDYFVFFHNSELVLGSNKTYPYRQFYDILFHYYDKSYESWQNIIRSENYIPRYIRADSARFSNRNYGVITYVRSLERNAGSIVILLNNDEISKLFDRMNLSEEGFAYVTDRYDNIITYSGEPGDFPSKAAIDFGNEIKNDIIYYDGKEFLATYIASNTSKLKYVLVEPLHVVLRQISYIKNITYVVTFSTLIFGIIISLYLTNRNVKPISELLVELSNHFALNKPERKKIKNIQSIKDAVFELIDNNNFMKLTIQEQQPFLKDWLIGSLLNGEFDTKVIAHILIDFGIDVNNKLFLVSIMKSVGNNHFNEPINSGAVGKSHPLQKIKDIVASILPKQALTYLIGIDKIVIIYFCDHIPGCNKKLAFFPLINSVFSELPSSIKHDIQISNGGIYREYTDIAKSYREAKEVLFFSMSNTCSNFLWYDDIKKESGKSYAFPIELQANLLNLTKVGDAEQVSLLLDRLFNDNIITQKLSDNITQLFLYELWGTLFKAIDRADIDKTQYEKIAQQISDVERLSIIEQMQLIKDCFLTICSFINTYRHNDDILVRRIVDCVSMGYSNPNFSIQAIADSIGYSVTYISQTFKKRTGENLSKYIEKVRIEEAISLLHDTGLSIYEIANKVGYSSLNTFCRAFKRVKGINASSLRETVKNLV